jgi:hypothetical protein
VRRLLKGVAELTTLQHESAGLIFVSNFAAARPFETNIGKLLPVVVAHDEAGVQFLDRPGRREAAGGHKRQWFK